MWGNTEQKATGGPEQEAGWEAHVSPSAPGHANQEGALQSQDRKTGKEMTPLTQNLM